MIAVSQNVDDRVRPINRQNCTCGRKHSAKHDEDRHTAPGVRGYGSVRLNHSEKVVTRTRLHTMSLIFAEFDVIEFCLY